MQKIKPTQFLLVYILSLGTLPLFAQQVVIINVNTSPPPQIPSQSVFPSENRKEVMTGVEALMNDYAKAASMLDPSNRQITRESMGRFKSLFVPSAEVVHDYLEFVPVEPIPLETYIDEAFRRLGRTGINVKLGKVDLLKIEDDLTAGYWVVHLRVEKFSYNYVSESQEVLKSDGGRYMLQEFVIDVKKNDFSKVLIRKIIRICRANECKTAADYVRYIGPSFSIFKPFVNATTSNYWNQNYSDNKLDVTGDFSFSGGIDIATNRFSKSTSADKRFFASIGAHFRYTRLKTKLDDFSIVPFDTIAIDEQNNQDSYLRSVDAISVEEKLEIGTIEVPIGVGLKLSKINKKHDFIIWASVIPSYNMVSSVSLKGVGTHNACIYFAPNSYWCALERPVSIKSADAEKAAGYGPFRIGKDLDYQGSPTNIKLKSVSFSAQLSPSFYFHLTENNPTWSFLLGLDLNYHFGSYLVHDDTNEDILKFPDATTRSVLQHYSENLSSFSIGLRVGLLHRLTTKP